MTTHRHPILLAIICLTFALPAFAEEKPGYDDTPMLPDSQWRVHDKNRPQAPVVEPGAKPGDPPSDAIILFDGKDISQWEGLTADAIEDGAINVVKTKGLTTKQRVRRLPAPHRVGHPRRGRRKRHELGQQRHLLPRTLRAPDHRIQGLPHIYADGIAGAIYGQFPPLANPSRQPGQWQTFDAVFVAPKFDGDKLVEPARMTVFWNGVLVQYHQEILGATMHKMFPKYDTKIETGPLVIQQHHSAVRLRNIWIRPLDLEANR